MTCCIKRGPSESSSITNRFPVELWHKTFFYLGKIDFYHLLIAASSSILALKCAAKELRQREWRILRTLFPQAQSEFFSFPPKDLFTALVVSPSSLGVRGLKDSLPFSLFCCPAKFLPALKILAFPPRSIETISPIRYAGDPITILVLARMTQRDQCAVFGWAIRMLPLLREEASPLVEAIKDSEIRSGAQKYLETLPSSRS